MAEGRETGVMLVLKVLLWLVLTVYWAVESLVLSLVPRKYRRKDITGNIALVTGGGSGIGRLMCLQLAAKGAIVVTWDVDTSGNQETARLVVSAGGQCRPYTVDLCDRQAIYAAAAKVKQEVGKVDILINNAGVVTGHKFVDCPDDSILRTFQVNAISHCWTVKAFLEDMITKDKGHIVTIASMAGKIPCDRMVDYCASKYAAVGFHDSLTVEIKLQRSKVKTTLVCPTFITTGMFHGFNPGRSPKLRPEWVAEEVVDGLLMDEPELLLPRAYGRSTLLMKELLPRKSLEFVGRLLGAADLMKEFVGRKGKKQ